MLVSIIPFLLEEHLDETVRMLFKVREANPTYPPPIDADLEGVASFTEWLLKDEMIFRWVAVAGGKVIGHAALSNPHEYILNFLSATEYKDLEANSLCEIVKLFVDPGARAAGVGRSLLLHAINAAVSLSCIPVLAVIESSKAARKLYLNSSLEEVGTFNGIHGKNYVFLSSSGDSN